MAQDQPQGPKNSRAPEGTTKYFVSWLQYRRTKTFIGFCSREWKAAFVGNLFKALIVRDLYADEKTGWCEEGKRCLALDCPLNRTTRESFLASHGLKQRQLSNQKFQRLVSNLAQLRAADILPQHVLEKPDSWVICSG